MNDQVNNPLFKAVSALVLAIFGSWTEAAAFLAALYSAVLILEWAFKRSYSVLIWLRERKKDDGTQ